MTTRYYTYNALTKQLAAAPKSPPTMPLTKSGSTCNHRSFAHGRDFSQQHLNLPIRRPIFPNPQSPLNRPLNSAPVLFNRP